MQLLILAVLASGAMQAPLEVTEANLYGSYSISTGFGSWSVTLKAKGRYDGRSVDDVIVAGEGDGTYKGRWRYVNDVVKLSELKKRKWVLAHTLIPVKWNGVMHLVETDYKGAFARHVNEDRAGKAGRGFGFGQFLKRSGKPDYDGPFQLLVPRRFLDEFTRLIEKTGMSGRVTGLAPESTIDNRQSTIDNSNAQPSLVADPGLVGMGGQGG